MVVDAWVAVEGQRSEFRLMSVTYHYAPIAETPFRWGCIADRENVHLFDKYIIEKHYYYIYYLYYNHALVSQ